MAKLSDYDWRLIDSLTPNDTLVIGCCDDESYYESIKVMQWSRKKKVWCDYPDGDRFENYNPTHWRYMIPRPNKNK